MIRISRKTDPSPAARGPGHRHAAQGRHDRPPEAPAGCAARAGRTCPRPPGPARCDDHEVEDVPGRAEEAQAKRVKPRQQFGDKDRKAGHVKRAQDGPHPVHHGGRGFKAKDDGVEQDDGDQEAGDFGRSRKAATAARLGMACPVCRVVGRGVGEPVWARRTAFPDPFRKGCAGRGRGATPGRGTTGRARPPGRGQTPSPGLRAR